MGIPVMKIQCTDKSYLAHYLRQGTTINLTDGSHDLINLTVGAAS